jgi:serine/threonine protein kinase/tetratricopeptide (TPR) repeat protein
MDTGPRSIDALLCQAVELASEDDRRRFLDQACGGDAELRRQVEELVRHHFAAGSFLENPALAPTSAGDAPTERPGTLIGPYKLLEQIGEGGMGIVFMAEQQQPVRRRVALKIIKPGMDTRQVVARFEAERQALALMDHPNIARVLDAGATESGRPHFVMELVRGVPITRYCDEAKLPIRQRLELFITVCRAVQHAHQKGIIHRDLKPSNVLVTLHDGVPVPKVIDFGVAKAANPQLTERTFHTGFAQMIGTPAYMSPEQAGMSAMDIDTRSDVYSLGVLLYELLTGSTPFERQTLREAGPDEFRRLIREVDPPVPSSRISTLAGEAMSTVAACRASEPQKLRTIVRGELDWIVMKALEKDRNRRYESASAFAADVERYLNGEVVQACPPSTPYRIRKFLRRHKGPVAAALLVLLTLVGGATGTTIGLVRALKAESLAKGNEEKAREETHKATESHADTRAFTDFLVHDMLAVARPEGLQGGLGINVTVAQALEAAEANLEGRFAERPLAEATARDAIGKTWRNLAKFKAAERHLRRAVELREREVGLDDPATLDSRNSLGVLLTELGRYAEAIELLEETLKHFQIALGSEHRDTLNSMRNLASAHQAAGHYAQALALFAETVEKYTEQLGPDHPDTLACTNDLGTAYGYAGRFDEGLALHEQILKKLTAQLGPDNPVTLGTMSNIAFAYGEARDFEKALPLFGEVLKKQQAKLGPDHPDTLKTMFNFGVAYRDADRLQDAEPLMAAALDGARRRLTIDHPDTQLYLTYLANLKRRMRKYQDAISLYVEALDTTRAMKGDDDPDTIITAYHLAITYSDAGQLDSAEAVIKEWLPRGQAKLDLGHQYRQLGVDTAVKIYQRMERPEKAEPLWRQLASSSKEKDGADSPKYAEQLVYLGENLLAQRRPADAQHVFRECLAIRQQTEPDAWTTFYTLAQLGTCFLIQKQYADAEPLLLSAYDGLKAREDKIPSDPRKMFLTFHVPYRLVELYKGWGQQDKANEWRKKFARPRPAKDAPKAKTEAP